MIIFEQTLRQILIDTNLVARRVFLMRAPQVPAPEVQAPYLVFFAVGPTPYVTHHGPLALTQRLYQVSVFDSQQSRALAIADSLRAALDTLHGDFANVHIGHFLYQTQTWSFEIETQVFQIIQEYSVQYSFLELLATPYARPSKGKPHHGNRNASAS
jgi:hypothetical protein